MGPLGVQLTRPDPHVRLGHFGLFELGWGTVTAWMPLNTGRVTHGGTSGSLSKDSQRRHRRQPGVYRWHRLNFLLLPHQHGSFLLGSTPGWLIVVRGGESLGTGSRFVAFTATPRAASACLDRKSVV